MASQAWSIRRIARELKLHRRTVRRYLQPAQGDSKCTTISTPGKIGRKSICESVAQAIAAKAAQPLSAQRIYQDLKAEFQFTGSYSSVKRFVRRWRQTQPAQVWRIEVAPGRC